MIFKLVPEYYFERFDMASADFLKSKGIKGIVLDVDNTLEPYENALPGEHVKEWLESLRAVGISAAIVSNNNSERITLFNSALGLPAYSKSKKPFKKYVLRAMSDMGCNRTNTILMGDQVFTDVLAAHNTGIPAILVPPINDKRDAFTKFKRLLEKPILRKYKNKQKNKAEK